MSKAAEAGVESTMEQEMEGFLQYAKPGNSSYERVRVKLTRNLCVSIYEADNSSMINVSVNLKRSRVEVVPGGRNGQLYVFQITTIITREDIGKSKKYTFGCDSAAALDAWVRQLRTMQDMDAVLSPNDYEGRWWCVIM